MPQRVLLLVMLLVGCASSQEMATCKTVSECQIKLRAWEGWADKNMPICKAAMRDADRLEAQNTHLQGELEIVRHQGTPGAITAALVAIVLTIVLCVGFGLWQLGSWMKRNRLQAKEGRWQATPASKQLATLICGAIWVSVAAVIAANDNLLSRHPVNMLSTVLVYSIPAFAFSGIAFWWFGRGAGKE